MLRSLILFILLTYTINGISQEKEIVENQHKNLTTIAMEMITEAGLCALVTHDTSDNINVRMMEPFPPEEELTVWFGTNSFSRKVQDIKANPEVTLYYASTDASGYVVIHGQAFLIDDAALKQKYWMHSWEGFYKEDRSNYILIKVIPESMEILNTNKGINGDTITWKVPSINLE